MNSKDSKRPKSYTLLLDLEDKIDLQRSDRYAALSDISMHYTRKNIKVIPKQ